MQEGIRVDFKGKKRGGREIDQVIEGGWQPKVEGWQGEKTNNFTKYVKIKDEREL